MTFLLGGRTGFNLSSLRSDLLDNEIAKTNGNKKARLGINAGGVLELNLTPYITFLGEITYSMRGIRHKLPEEDIHVEIYEEYNYLEIPIILEIRVPLKTRISPTFHAGMAPAFLVTAEVIEEEGSETSIKDVQNKTRSSDMTFLLGVGVESHIGNGRMYSELRYSHGLVNII